MTREIRVLIVDDSPFMCRVISDILEAEDDLRVVGTVHDGHSALKEIRRLKPDLVTLDLHMPSISGLETLERIMRTSPLPVVILSSWAREGAEVTISALELGAVTFVTKPGLRGRDLERVGRELVSKVREAAVAEPKKLKGGGAAKPAERTPSAGQKGIAGREGKTGSGRGQGGRVVVIGASTGGPRALHTIFSRLPEGFGAAVLVVQHMPAGFTASLAERLDGVSGIPVFEARDGMRVEMGTALVAPGNHHLLLKGSEHSPVVALNSDPPHNRHRPAVDLTMFSAARVMGERAVGVVLTGMGSDGAEGVVRIHRAGGRVIVEDESTAVIYGMSRAARDTGCVDRILPLGEIAGELVRTICNREVG